MHLVKTCKVVNPLEEGGFFTINESDFVDGVHTLYSQPEAQSGAAPSTENKPSDENAGGDTQRGICDLNSVDAQALIASANLEALAAFEKAELAHATYEGGRKKVLEAIASRRKLIEAITTLTTPAQ